MTRLVPTIRCAAAAFALLAGLTMALAQAPAARALSYTEALAQLSGAHDAIAKGERAGVAADLTGLIERVSAEPSIDDELRGDVLAAAHSELAGLAWRDADGAAAATHLNAAIAAYGEARLKQLTTDYILQHLALAAMHAQAGALERANTAFDKAEAHIKVMFADQVNNRSAFQIIFKREMTRAYIDLSGAPSAAGVENTAGATRIAESLGTPYAAVHQLTEAFALAALGRLDDAARKADDAAGGGLPFGRDYVSRAMLFRAGALASLGQRDEALKLARAAEGYAESNDAQVAVLQILTDLEDRDADDAWPTRYDPSSATFFMALVPRMRLTSQILERGDTRLPRPTVDIGYAFDFVEAE